VTEHSNLHQVLFTYPDFAIGVAQWLYCVEQPMDIFGQILLQENQNSFSAVSEGTE